MSKELKAKYAYTSDEIETVGSHAEGNEYYLKSEVDNVIAEKDAEIARLKDELDAANNQCENLINSATDIMLRQDKVNDAKCDELESLKASHYAEMVDAGMRERRLRRALYKACANWAHEKDDRYYLKYVCISDDARIQYERWRKMERKCRAKAEEYK